MIHEIPSRENNMNPRYGMGNEQPYSGTLNMTYTYPLFNPKIPCSWLRYYLFSDVFVGIQIFIFD